MTLGPLTFWSGAFWLLPPVLLALILLKLYRQRRQEILTGSLLLWRRLAAQQPKTPPRRVFIDRSLVLQALAMILLVSALAGPSFGMNSQRGRGLLIVLDNGAAARARAGGEPLWAQIREKSTELLRRLEPEDQIFVARTSPFPKLLNAAPVSPDAAIKLISSEQPALSGPGAEKTWLFAADAARSLGKDNRLALAVFSLQDAPLARATPSAQWHCAAPRVDSLHNVGIIGFGSVPVVENGRTGAQVLVRVKNYGNAPAAGTVALAGVSDTIADQRPVQIPAGDELAAVFTLPAGAGPIRIAWKAPAADALQEDDAIVAAPQPVQAPRVRFHKPVPALEQLYKTALNATIVSTEDSAPADLEIYASSVPERVPDTSRAVMLLAPESGYRGIFDIGDKTLNWPKAQRDESDPLTQGVADKAAGSFGIPKAVEILPTGDFKKLVKDSNTDRALVARFTEESGRIGFVFSFVPGAGFAADRLLEPDLAALLVRMALEAAGSAEPYQVTRTAELELQKDAPMPQDWRADSDIMAAGGAGVLDEYTSALPLGRPSAGSVEIAALQPLSRENTFELRWPLIVIGLFLIALEFYESSGGRLTIRRALPQRGG